MPKTVVATWIVLTMATHGSEIQPKIAPGYNFEKSQTERSISMELKEYETAVQQSALRIKDEPLNEYVRTIACRVAARYCPDIRVYVIRNPNYNAFMTANGMMVIFTGLLVRMPSEDGLAAVIGHELAHYTQLHTLERFVRIKKSMAAGTAFNLGFAILTGVSEDIGTLGAQAHTMSFSRSQEAEADLLGVQFMAQSGYDPHAAAEVWRIVVNEESKAVEKRREPNVFTQTHPDAEDRIKPLDAFVESKYPDFQPELSRQEGFVAMLDRYYVLLMEDQLDTNRFGRTEAMLSRHWEIGVNPSLIEFFRGEMYRQRAEEGDLELAEKAYVKATQGVEPIADAYVNLGYLYLKKGDKTKAVEHFQRYLTIKPDADDKAMIEFYISGAGS